MFTRQLEIGLIKRLKGEDLFKNELVRDVRAGSVFAAIRNNRVDFYHKGGKLFSFSKTGFSTHIKYATTPADNTKYYITEQEFTTSCGSFIKSFVRDYNKIKVNCELYSKGSESAGVSYLYSKYSFMEKQADIVVLDIEVSLESNEDGGQDRIDVLLYSKNTRELKFVEAKLYTNKEIRSEGTPEVIGQIKRYDDQINSREGEILNAYKTYVEAINELFEIELMAPTKILPEAGLYIFEFDDDQRKGNLSNKVLPKLKGKGIKYYSLGNPVNINIQTLWNTTTKPCNL